MASMKLSRFPIPIFPTPLKGGVGKMGNRGSSRKTQKWEVLGKMGKMPTSDWHLSAPNGLAAIGSHCRGN